MGEVIFIMTNKRKRVERKNDLVKLRRNQSQIESQQKENNAFAFNIGSYTKNVETQLVVYDKKVEQGG